MVYPTYGGMLSILKKRGFPVPESFVIITDFVVHVQWFHDGMDAYFVPSREVEFHIYRKGVVCGKVDVTGIPINPEFDNFREENRDTLPISACMSGMTPSVVEICQTVEETAPQNLRIVLICGTDKRLCQRVKKSFRRIQAVEGDLTYKEMARYMRRSILLISKADGITTSEALYAEMPLLIYKPLPGQKYYNILYLLKN